RREQKEFAEYGSIFSLRTLFRLCELCVQAVLPFCTGDWENPYEAFFEIMNAQSIRESGMMPPRVERRSFDTAHPALRN
ncbi:MAG TPA: hypothetical protein VLK84_17885, partial [Longimicrobium sp.]|nr:hypothetical protein [Longimicrobium sp.]